MCLWGYFWMRLASELVDWDIYEIPTAKGNGTPLQYSCLENPWTEEPGGLQVHGVPKSQTWLSDFTFTFHFHALEKAMATHSSVLAWRIPGTGEPGGLPSMGSHGVGHNWSDLAAVAAAVSHLTGKDWKLLPVVSGIRQNVCSHHFYLIFTEDFSQGN